MFDTITLYGVGPPLAKPLEITPNLIINIGNYKICAIFLTVIRAIGT